MHGQYCHDFQEDRKEEEKLCLGRLEGRVGRVKFFEWGFEEK